jgi:hypothetical protein
LFPACMSYGDEDELGLPEQIEPLYAEPQLTVEAEPNAVATSEQEDPASEPPPSEICKKAVQEARDDFARGSMHLDAWGYPTRCAFEYWNLLAKWYGIHTHHHGCMIGDEPDEFWERRDCYSAEVDRLVFAKYGDDAYERASKKAGCH